MAEHKIITNLESKDIYVFPAGLRGSNYNKSKFTTEDNLILFNKISANNKNLNRVYLNPFGEGLIIKIAGYCFTIMPEILEDQFPDIREFEDSNLYALITLVDKGDGIGKVLANVNPSVASGVAPEMAGDYIYTLDSQEGTFYKFLGLVFVDDNGLADIINNSYYKNKFSDDEYKVEYLKIKESGSLSFLTQKLALDASEIRNTENSDESLSEALNTDTLRVNTITAKTSNPIQFNSRNYFGNMDVNFSGSTGSSVNISKNVTVVSNTTLGAAATGGITVKSSGSGNTTIIGPGGGTINLPANYSGAGTTNAVLAQTGSSATSRWLNYDKANTANTLVLRDNNNINATTFNNVYVTKGTNSFKIWAGGSTVDASTTKAYIKMNGKLTVASGVAATLNSNISIAANSPVDIDVPFNVGADGKTGGVNVSSSANKATTIIGPSDGTTILPDSNVVPQAAATGYKYIWAQHHDKDSGVHTNSWIPVSALVDQPNAIVMTDAEGKVHATIEGLIDKADKVLQKVNTTDKDYRLAFTTLTAENHESLAHTSGITVNPSTKTITATNFAGRASESTKVKVAQDTTNAEYRILFSPTTTAGSYVEIKYTNSSLYVNPNTGVLGATELKSTTITNTGAISSDTVSATTSMTAPIFIGDLRGNADTATKFKDNATVQLTGDVTGSVSSQHGWTVATTLVDVNANSGSWGLSSNATPGFGVKFNVPYFTVNAKGLITAASTKTVQIPATIAKYDTLGLVKPAYTSTGEASFTTTAATNTSTPIVSKKTTIADRYYGIEADKNGRLFVNVPWMNTTYGASDGIKLDGTTFKHSHILTAKSTANNAATVTPGFGGTITTYETLYNTYGHVTGTSSSTITIPATIAKYNTLGLVKPAYTSSNAATLTTAADTNTTTPTIATKSTTSGRYYGVEADKNGMLFVNVPWTDTTYSFTDNNPTLAWSTKSKVATVGGVDIHVTMPANPNTNTAHKHSAGDGISLSGSGGTSGTTKISLAAVADLTTGSFGNSANQTPGYGGTFKVPYITVDTYGRITSISDKTVKIPDSDNTNTSHSHSAGVGLTGSGSAGTSTGTYTYKVNLVKEDKSSNAASYTAGGSSKFYAVQLDKNSKLGVYVPWSNTTYTFTDHNPTLDWETKSKVATVGGTEIHVTMPKNPNTDTKVTAVGNHYTPTADSSYELTAKVSSTSSYAKDTVYTVLTGVKAQRDAKGHITGLTYTAQKIMDTNTTYSFSNKAATLAWDTTKTIATVGGTDITVKLPANPNSDKKVTQSLKEDGNNYYLILKNTNNATNETAGVNYSKLVYVTPNSGRLTAQSFNAASDARLKENFEKFKLDRKSILDLPVYRFDFKEGLKNQIGCKAQDLQEICPEIVDENSEGFLSIQESKIVYLLLEEVKQLKAEIEALKNK